MSPLLREGQLATDSKSKAEILLQQFSSVFTKKMTGPMPIVQKQVEECLENMKIDKKGVQKLLQNINPSKASGPDEIPNIVLKECSNELSVAVTFLFQKSLNSGSLPDDWKNANVAPIYKKVTDIKLKIIDLSLSRLSCLNCWSTSYVSPCLITLISTRC